MADTNTTSGPTPLDGLLSSAQDYFSLVAAPVIERAIKEPANPSLAVAAFTLLFHVRDWALKEDTPLAATFWRDCPFAMIVAEIANGGKHKELTHERFTKDPHVLRFQVCGYGQGGYGVGPFGAKNIQVHGRRHADDTPRWWSLRRILTEVRAWWATALAIPEG